MAYRFVAVRHMVCTFGIHHTGLCIAIASAPEEEIRISANIVRHLPYDGRIHTLILKPVYTIMLEMTSVSVLIFLSSKTAC